VPISTRAVLLPTLIPGASTEAVYDSLGAANRELLVSDFVRMELLAGADAFARLEDLMPGVRRWACRSTSGQPMRDSRAFMPGGSSEGCARPMQFTLRSPRVSTQTWSRWTEGWREPPANWALPPRNRQ
jgi:hypothetical protein